MMIDEKLVAQVYSKHKSAFEFWDYGTPQDTWIDDNGNLCIKYNDGSWWHYNIENGEATWW